MQRLTPASLALTVLAGVSLLPSHAHAWGSLGHRMIAETAAILVEKERAQDWGPLLARHRGELGFYSFAPDSIYRHDDSGNGQIEAPTHFFDVDVMLQTQTVSPAALARAEEFPVDYEQAQATIGKQIGSQKFAAAGTSPWRIEQFMDLVWQELKDIKEVKGGYQRGMIATGDVRKIFLAIEHLGILAHYTGDATMPYHATSDWNGWQTGEGGIHFYYESDCLNALEPALSVDVLKSARAHAAEWRKRWKAETSRPARSAIRVYLESFGDLDPIRKIDHKKVIVKTSQDGTKMNAERKPPHVGCVAFRPLLIENLAKGAVLTATYWERILPTGVDFTQSTSLQFSDYDTHPEFVKPDFKTPAFLKAEAK